MELGGKKAGMVLVRDVRIMGVCSRNGQRSGKRTSRIIACRLVGGRSKCSFDDCVCEKGYKYE